jgi:hypothetical protein
MQMPHEVSIAYWTAALEAEIGIAIEVEGNREAVRAEMYAARVAEGDPAFHELIVFLPTRPMNEIWVVKKATDLEDDDASTPWTPPTEGDA